MPTTEPTRDDFEYTTPAGVEVKGSVTRLPKTNQRVWALTTFERAGQRTPRTVGLFKRRSQATAILKKDIGDLDEAGYYQYACIEPLPLGLYPINRAKDRLWFEHDREVNRWCLLPAEPEAMSACYRKMGAAGVGNWSLVG